MSVVQLGIGTFSRTPSYQPEVILKNMLVERDPSGVGSDDTYRIQRPGLKPYRTVASGLQVRGLFHMQGVLGSLPVAAVGNTLYKFDTGTSTSLGTIANDEESVQMAATNFGLAVVSYNALYFHNGTTLSTISLPGGAIPVTCCSINSYIIVGTAPGQWYWVEPSATTIDSLHFATAEQQPDNLVCLFTLQDEVFMFGTETTEIWQVSADPDEILVRAAGRTFDKGVMSRDVVCGFDNSIMFLGNDGIVYRVTGGNPVRVSNTGIEERVRNRTGIPSACSFTFDGHQLYALFIPGVGTFCYDVLSEAWIQFASVVGNDAHGWLGRTTAAMGSIMLVGDGDSGNIYTLDATINTDNGNVFERAVSGGAYFNNGRKRMDSLEIHTGSSANCTVRVRTHDGLDTGWSAYRTATARQGTDIVRMVRFAAAKSPCRVIEISTVDDVQLRISSCKVNEGRAN